MRGECKPTGRKAAGIARWTRRLVAVTPRLTALGFSKRPREAHESPVSTTRSGPRGSRGRLGFVRRPERRNLLGVPGVPQGLEFIRDGRLGRGEVVLLAECDVFERVRLLLAAITSRSAAGQRRTFPPDFSPN